ncbi:glycogen/starch synthase [Oscillospiraceae bacterium MB08-C2-2]|nr:glycogen/starch synthase [Oscillospiraceae bacterium MB08-C2-2]
MKILFAASEAVPYAASGGLADVAGSLTKSICGRGHGCRVVLPLYGDISEEHRQSMRFVASFTVVLGWRNQYCGVFEAQRDGVWYYFLDNEYYFKRQGLYSFYDDAERFAFFSKAVLDMLEQVDFEPEIIHCNDWQTGLIPVYLNTLYRASPKLREVKTVYTIHNIQYQGQYDLEIAGDVLGLPEPAVAMLEYGGSLNLMKGGIDQCDLLTTVSPTYAKEILDPYYAHGLEGFLQTKSYKLHGILNGIDTVSYDPAADLSLLENYSLSALKGKQRSKKKLQLELGLSPDSKAPMLAMVTRLASHKGLDLVQYIFGRIMDEGVQFVLLGSGDWQLEKFFREMVAQYPGRVSVTLGFEPPLARKIYAGADLFLMPSKSEPCGLAQMIALRYGTLPVVRSTGGLADSIIDVGDDGYGYTFQSYNAEDMLGAIQRGLADYAQPKKWVGLVKKAMACDFSWEASAGEYIRLYQQIVEG